jgi:hypothetical protein
VGWCTKRASEKQKEWYQEKPSCGNVGGVSSYAETL